MARINFFAGILLLGFASLHAALPTVKVTHEHSNEFDITNPSKNKDGDPLLLFEIDNPNEASFTLKIHFTNNCFLKLLNRASRTSFPLNSVKIRINNEIFWEWERVSPIDCEYSFVDFTKEEDIKDFYEIELLGSWGEGGHKLPPGTYGERVILTILPPNSR